MDIILWVWVKLVILPMVLFMVILDSPSKKRELPHSWDEFVYDSGKWKTGWNAFFGYADGENLQSKNRQVKPYESAEVKDDGYPDGLTTNLAYKN
jgi:hypothetical protein|tara:strand:+ start:196 stop:480 length:285 start_codon:yes stop_codon:yes gene_type:complete